MYPAIHPWGVSGQVAPDVTTMFTFTYNIGRIGRKTGQLEKL
jgi:hypothetical protein